MKKLISIDLEATFGFFRKPDINDGVSLSYNMLHKPALLGILGAILGLEGYTQTGVVPEYYQELQHLPIGIAPLNHEKGNFNKTVIKYSNTTGYANKRATFLTEEATLIAPAYRCYLLLDMNESLQQTLYQYLKNGQAEYIPYLGKNEFSAWWDQEQGVREYSFEQKSPSTGSFRIESIFAKPHTSINEQKKRPRIRPGKMKALENLFMYFERLPVGFDMALHQYELANFALTTFPLEAPTDIENLYYLKDHDAYVQLF